MLSTHGTIFKISAFEVKYNQQYWFITVFIAVHFVIGKLFDNDWKLSEGLTKMA